MKQRNQRLALAAVVLLVVNIAFLSVGNSGTSATRQPAIAIQDTSRVEAITMTMLGKSHTLRREADSWTLNDQYNTDPAYTKILLAVLSRVSVKRELGQEQLGELVGRLDQEGVRVQVSGVDRAFHVIGNRTFTKTYFIEEAGQKGYEVEIPGYRDYVGGIFQLSEDQWRDRLIFRGNFHTIQSIRLQSDDESLFDLRLDSRYFTIEGLNAYDTTALVNYLNGFSYVQANERISPGKFPRYDSLSQTPPELQVTIKDLGRTEPLELNVYPALPGETYQLVQVNDADLVVFASTRLEAWFRDRSSFAVN